MLDIFSIFLLKLEIYYQDISKTKNTNNWIFFANKVIYFWNQLRYEIKNNYSVEKSSNLIKLFLK